MSDLRELYQTMILDHYKKPRNFGRPTTAPLEAVGDNPLCGDRITVFLDVDDEGAVREVGFEGTGCAISTASASMMTELVKGRPAAEVQELFERFHDVVTGEREADPEALGKLAVFAGVREFPLRVKCATLAWHTLRAALGGRPETVTTE
jgi:nitrogen fixation NifU-like protein